MRQRDLSHGLDLSHPFHCHLYFVTSSLFSLVKMRAFLLSSFTLDELSDLIADTVCQIEQFLIGRVRLAAEKFHDA